VIPKNQFGFKKNNSTVHANLKLMETVINGRKNGKLVAIILINVRKAFDSCNHDIILSKLRCAGANETTLKWVKSYLTNRSQYVKIGDAKSKEMLINLGVGQGTCLGPLLFKIYLFDLPLCTLLFTLLFADDTSLVAISETIEELERLCNNELNKVNNWFESNGLTLHPEKTKVMVIGTREEINVNLNGIRIKQCGSAYEEKSINVLGIEWDCNLNWDEHIKKVIKKIGTGIYLMSRFRRLLTNKTRKLLYNSLIRSHIIYGLEIWGNSKGTMMNKLNRKHKHALRLLDPGKWHTGPIRKKNGILTIQEEYSKSLKILAWKLLRGLAPSTLKDAFIWRDNNARNLRVNNRVTIPRFRQEKLRQQFTTNLAKEINNITHEEENWSIGKFKNFIRKKYLTGINGDVFCNNDGCRECN
jgi:hypothetical protein